MTRHSRYPLSSAKADQDIARSKLQQSPHATALCAIELRLSTTQKERLLAIVEAGILGGTVDEVISHYTRDGLHRDWLAQEAHRGNVSPLAAPAPAQPAKVRSIEAPIECAQGRNKRLIRLPEVCNRISVSRSSLYMMISRKSFPPPKNIGGRTVAWLESEVEEWIESKTSARRE